MLFQHRTAYQGKEEIGPFAMDDHASYVMANAVADTGIAIADRMREALDTFLTQACVILQVARTSAASNHHAAVDVHDIQKMISDLSTKVMTS